MGSVEDVVAERLEKSYQVFEARFPDLSKKLHSIGEPTSEVVWEGESAVNIDMKGTNLYPDHVEGDFYADYHAVQEPLNSTRAQE